MKDAISLGNKQSTRFLFMQVNMLLFVNCFFIPYFLIYGADAVLIPRAFIKPNISP